MHERGVCARLPGSPPLFPVQRHETVLFLVACVQSHDTGVQSQLRAFAAHRSRCVGGLSTPLKRSQRLRASPETVAAALACAPSSAPFRYRAATLRHWLPAHSARKVWLLPICVAADDRLPPDVPLRYPEPDGSLRLDSRGVRLSSPRRSRPPPPRGRTGPHDFPMPATPPSGSEPRHRHRETRSVCKTPSAFACVPRDLGFGGTITS